MNLLDVSHHFLESVRKGFVQFASTSLRYARRFWELIWRRPRHPQALTAIYTTEIPEDVEVGKLYIVGEGIHRWYAVFACPCGCAENIHLSLIEGDRPCWRVTQDESGAISISPSIWRNRGCRSHFFVRKGDIFWCSEEEL